MCGCVKNVSYCRSNMSANGVGSLDIHSRDAVRLGVSREGGMSKESALMCWNFPF